jgi:hypothetical protein
MITNHPTLAFKGDNKTQHWWRPACAGATEGCPPPSPSALSRRPLLILALDHTPGITAPPTPDRRPSTHPSANALSSGFASFPGMRWGRGRGPQEVRLRCAKRSFCAYRGWKTPALAQKQGTQALKQAKAKGQDTARRVRGTPPPCRRNLTGRPCPPTAGGCISPPPPPLVGRLPPPPARIRRRRLLGDHQPSDSCLRGAGGAKRSTGEARG